MEEVDVRKGIVLLAEPFSQDSHFKRSAVVLTDHQKEGTVGFIINKPLDIQIEELLSDFPEFDTNVYFGGPVATDSIHYIHNVGEMLDDSIKVANGIYWGGDFEKLKFLIDSKLILPRNIRFFVGYAGWGAGQLAAELSYGSWVLADAHANYLFKSPPGQLWQQIMKNKGDTYSVIANVPDSVNWN